MVTNTSDVAIIPTQESHENGIKRIKTSYPFSIQFTQCFFPHLDLSSNTVALTAFFPKWLKQTTNNTCLKAISTQEKFPRTENFPKISRLKFSTSKFFPTENLCRPKTFYKIFFLRIFNPRANGTERRARVLIPSGYSHPGKRKHQRSLKFINDRGRG